MSLFGSDDGHRAQVEKARRQKDEWMAGVQGSPLSHESKHGFNGLLYFEYDSAFRVSAVFSRLDAPRIVMLGTSTGREKQFHEFGRFEFDLDGKRVGLMAYKKVRDPNASHHTHEAPSVFIPFRDATSGKESYGASRYLDLPEPENGPTEVDFNSAYNPYCAYNEAYTCPLPPRENWLTVAIRAGEKEFPRSH